MTEKREGDKKVKKKKNQSDTHTSGQVRCLNLTGGIEEDKKKGNHNRQVWKCFGSIFFSASWINCVEISQMKLCWSSAQKQTQLEINSRETIVWNKWSRKRSRVNTKHQRNAECFVIICSNDWPPHSVTRSHPEKIKSKFRKNIPVKSCRVAKLCQSCLSTAFFIFWVNFQQGWYFF